MLTNLAAALLAAVLQGFLEFLPVSSSGHLALLALITQQEQTLLVISLLHVGTALAAIVYQRRAYRRAIAGLWHPGIERRFVIRCAMAQAATAAVAIPLALALTQTAAARWYGSPAAIGAMMLLNAAILTAAPRGNPSADVDPAPLPVLEWRSALWVGLVQGIAAMPGLSRSGLTIAAGLRAGLSRRDAANLSFLLAPPVILASAVFWTAQALAASPQELGGWSSMLVALAMLAAAFGVAWCALHWVSAWVRAGRLWWFAPWSAGVGVAALVVAAL